MKYPILIIVFLIALSGIVYATETEQVFTKYENITLKRSCYYNNTWCDSSTTCNITISNPNDIIAVSNQAMTFNPSYFSYFMGEHNLTGTYRAFMTCNSHGLNGFDDFTFKITRTGAELNSYNITLYIIGIVGILAFAILMIVLANKINFQSESLWVANINSIIKWFMINLAATSSLIIVYFIRFILETQEKGNTFLISVFDTIGLVLMYFLGAFFLFTLGIMIYSFIENSMIAKKMKEEAEEND